MHLFLTPAEAFVDGRVSLVGGDELRDADLGFFESVAKTAGRV
jgi:hypothetical protein